MRCRLGMWSAIAAFVASVGYAVPQLLQVADVLQDPWDRILIFGPSLALAPAFVLTVVATQSIAANRRQIWSIAALAFAILYAADVSLVYVTQLGSVIPHDLAGDGSAALASCCRPGMPMTALDLLGYTYMALSCLLLAGAFPASSDRWLRRTLVANGLLMPFLIGQLLWPSLIYVGAGWLVLFPAAMALLAVRFTAEKGQAA